MKSPDIVAGALLVDGKADLAAAQGVRDRVEVLTLAPSAPGEYSAEATDPALSNLLRAFSE